jgi:hypothetical protein
MKFLFITLLIICLFNFSCTLNKKLVVINPPQVVETTINCSYPFTLSNNLIFLVFYKDAMRFLTNGDEMCRNSFAKKLKEEVKASFFIPKGCITWIVDDINDAIHNPLELQKRLNYL